MEAGPLDRAPGPFRKLKGLEAGPVIQEPSNPEGPLWVVMSSCAATGGKTANRKRRGRVFARERKQSNGVAASGDARTSDYMRMPREVRYNLQHAGGSCLLRHNLRKSPIEKITAIFVGARHFKVFLVYLNIL